MQRRVNGKHARYHFSSLRELATYIRDTPRVWSQSSGEGNTPSHDWDLNAGFDNAVDMARMGWIEGAQRAQKALKAFAPATPKPDTKIDVYGYRPHMALYFAGAPNHMIRHTTRADTGRGRVITLAVSVVANAFTSAEAMANFGLAVAQYIRQLEATGMRVAVVGTYTADRAPSRLSLSWTIKNADQPLDLAVMAFAIGHPAMLRRLGLAFMERQSDVPYMSGYGTAQDTTKADLIDPAPGTIILNGMKYADSNAPTPEAGLEYVTAQIEAAQKDAWK
jgi:hypothetical protein